METYYVHINPGNLTKDQCRSQLEIYIKRYDGKVTFVSEYASLMFVDVPERKPEERERFKRTIEDELEFVEEVEGPSGKVGIV